jgi:hypothetical protein
MSAIAHGYALSASALKRANFYPTNKDLAGMWEHLHQREIPEQFPWPGYAIGILNTWLRDQVSRCLVTLIRRIRHYGPTSRLSCCAPKE